MVTVFGKQLRRLRLDRDELMKDMADKLDVTPAYLSSIENGKRQPTEELLNRLLSAYDLAKDDVENIIEARNRTLKEIKIELNSGKTGSDELGLLFARKFDGLTEKQISDLTAMLKN